VIEALLAHGIVGREDLPIPREFFIWGATIVLVVSFVGLATLWPKPRLEGDQERRAFGVPRAVEVVCGAVGIAVFAVVVWAGLAGTQTPTANLAPRFVYVLLWVGVPILSVVFGDVFRAFSPWRAIGRAAGWVASRTRGGSLPEPLPYPERLGRWPAVAGLLAFAWLELAFADRDDPSLLAILALAYMAVQLVGMALYGVEAWHRNGDAFGTWFRLCGSLSPLHWRDGALWLRRPLSGVTHVRRIPGTVAFLAVAIGSTTFDGLREDQFWADIALDVQEALEPVMSAARGLEVAYTLGLLVIIGLVYGLYWLGVLGMRTVESGHGRTDLARRFVHSLVPIAFAYVLAHYFSLLAYEGQATAFLASDPLGKGWDLFGTASSTIDYGIVSANGIWYVQVGALVLGHVAGLVLAHDRALVVFSDARRATSSQYWMLAVMVAFTTIGLLLLSS
jgi:hypothetical protein